MWCHLVFALPLLALPVFWVLPLPQALAVYVPVSALALGTGVVAVRALVAPATTGPEAMRGRRARVATTDGRRHVVKVDDELWTASCRDALGPGDRVVIVDVEGLTLRVRRAD
ncbi:MAG: NfeD family protein [Candidatus Rokubacteria bacterium]|nr:NfeD family protein [Candidatus Rokubacteria bacterium]